MGAKIRGAGTDTITIEGVEHLKGCTHEIIPDRIEAGTFLIMAAAAGERVIIQNIIPQHLESLISKLKEMGVKMVITRTLMQSMSEHRYIQVLRQIYNSH